MKKQIILTAAVLLCLLTACGKADSEPDAAPPPAAPAEVLPEEAPVKGEEPAIPRTGRSAMLTAYTDVLEELYQSCEDPERFRYEDGPSFALYDVDLDGTEELIVRDPAGEWTRIYGYDAAVYVELEEYTCSGLYYYGNGTVAADWSHNQGAAGDKLWPYTVYQYDPGAGVYARLAGVDGWDKNLREIFDGEPFPDEVDQDGDGFIYYVIAEEGGYAPAYGEAMDGADYEAWRDSWLNGAEPTGPSFVPLVRENIDALGQQSGAARP